MGAEKEVRSRGAGSLFKNKGSNLWSIAFYVGGKQIREKTGQKAKGKAEKLLRDRLAAVDTGTFIAPDTQRVDFEALATMIELDYANKQRRSWRRAQRGVEQLRAHFGMFKAHAITTTRIEQYKGDRRAAGGAPATVDYELSILRRMFSLARKRGEVRDVPSIELNHVQNARAGFFERPDFEALREQLPEYLRPVMTYAYHTGWRVRSEILPLTWDRVDLDAGTVRLEPGTTKSGEARTFYVNELPELKAILATQRKRTTAHAQATGQIVPYVFHHDGQPIRDFRAAWDGARERAAYDKHEGDVRVLVRPQLLGRIPHDFRRTAVRNLERAGVSRSAAMKMVGHKTESIYQRYAIVSESDQREAVQKLAALAARDAEQRPGVLPFAKTGTDR